MKKIIIALAASIMWFGCQKSDLAESAMSEEFTAAIERFDLATKTSMNPDKQVVWSSGDCIALFRGSSLATQYKVSDNSVGKTNGVFSLVEKPGDDFYAGTELPCNVALYPYSESVVLSGTLLEEQGNAYKIDGPMLPKVQYYASESFTNGAFLMAAVTESQEDRHLNFKNVLGALKLQLKGTQVVKSIKVEGANGEKLAGPVTVTVYANNLTPSIDMSSEASTEVTLDCRDGILLNEAIATNFYIALPPVHFEKGFTMTVIDSDEKVHTISATVANTVNRSSILVMPVVTLESDTNLPSNSTDYVDEYGVNHGPGVKIDGVVWAPVNCGYHAEDYKWGKLYQWGRKYGQGYDGDATTPEIVDGNVSLSFGQSETNKNVFFKGFNWLSTPDLPLWNSGTEESPIKTEYDPCPNGWRVPTYIELNGLRQNNSSWTAIDSGQSGYWFSGSIAYNEDVPQVFLPAPGFRDLSGQVYWRGTSGYYWPSEQSTPANYLLFNADGVQMGYYYPALGHSVRCVQDVSSAGTPDTPEEDEEELVIPVMSIALNSTSLDLYSIALLYSAKVFIVLLHV